MQDNKKFFTTIKTFNCVGKEGKQYHGVGAVLSLTSIREKQIGDKAFVGARCAINNRTKTINTALGTSFDSDVIWVDVAFWEDKATRFLRFAGDREKLTLGIFGTIKAEKFNKTDGTEGEAITITVDEWFSVGVGNSRASKNTEEPSITPTDNYTPTGYYADDDVPF